MNKLPAIPGVGGGFFRSLNPNYLPHRRIIGLVFIVSLLFGVAGMASGLNFLDAFLKGFNAGAAVFVAWVVGREVDPDEESSALLGAVIGGVLAGVAGSIALLALIELALLLRLLNRITGMPFLFIEYTAICSFGLILAFQGEPYFLGAVGIAFVLDGLLENGKPSGIFLGIAAVIGSILLWVGSTEATPPESHIFGLAVFVAVWLFFSARYVSSVTVDSGERKVLAKRVRAAQLYLLFFAVGWFFFQGVKGIADLSPAWCAMAGVLAYRLLKVVRARLA